MANNNSLNLSKISEDKLATYFNIDNGATLMTKLRSSNHLIEFFQEACKNKNWQATKPDLMGSVVQEISSLSDKGELSLETVRQICTLAKDYLLPDHPLNQNITISFKDGSTDILFVKSLLLKTIPFYRMMLQSGFKEATTKTLIVNAKTSKFMLFLVQSLAGENNLNLDEIQKHLKRENVEDLTDLFSRSIHEWQHPDLTRLIFYELKRKDPFLALHLAYFHRHEESIKDGLDEVSEDSKVGLSYQGSDRIKIFLKNLATDQASIDEDSLSNLKDILNFFIERQFSIELAMSQAGKDKNFPKDCRVWKELFIALNGYQFVKGFSAHRASQQDLVAFLQEFPFIEILKIQQYYFEGADSSKGFGDEVLDIASTLGIHLKEFFLLNSTRVTSAGIVRLINSCPNLEKIGNEEDLWDLIDYPLIELKKCKNLKQLRSTKGHINPDNILDVVKTCSQLEELVLYRPELSAEDLKTLFNFCPNLKKLTIENENLNNEILSLIAEKCPNLQQIQINSSARITNSGVLRMLTKCIKLKSVNLNNCSFIKLEDLKQIARKDIAIRSDY